MKTGLRILLFIILVCSFVAVLYVPYIEVREQTVRKINEKQMLLAKQASASMEFFFRDQMSLLKDLAQDPDIIVLSSQGNDEITNIQESHSDYIRAITRYDSKGTILYSYPNPNHVIGKNIGSQPHVKRLLEEKKPVISSIFQSIQGYQALAVAYPVFDKGGFVGAVSFLLDFRYIANTYLGGIQIGDDGYAWMISREGVELFCPVPGHIGVNIAETSKNFPSVLVIAERMKKGESGFGVYTYDMTKGKKIATIVKHAAYYPIRIGDNLWSIAVASPESEIYNELHGFYRKMIITVVLLLFTVGIIGYVMMKDYHLKKANEILEKRIKAEIEKRKHQEQLMLQQARFYSMGETLNAIAHQWRQPLNAIGLCVQDLEDAYKSGDLDERYIAETVKFTMNSLEGLSEVIDNFRTFFSQDEKPVPSNLCTLMKEVYGIVKAQLDSEEIGFTLLNDGKKADMGKVCCVDKYSAMVYPDMLKQVILICIQNAREAIRKSGVKGEIILNLSRNGDDFLIEIDDNGVGIPEGVMEKIFDPYFTTKDIHIGIGMGLYTAKEIMEEHMKGSITLLNTEKGVKSEIRFKAL